MPSTLPPFTPLDEQVSTFGIANSHGTTGDGMLVETDNNWGTTGTPVSGTLKRITEVGAVRRLRFELTDVGIAMSDTTTSGSLKLIDFPAGIVKIYGCCTNLTLAGDGDAIDADAAIVASLGTVAAGSGTTLTGTEADILPSTACTLTTDAGTFAEESTISALAALTDSSAGTPSATTIAALADGTTYANDVAALRNNLATIAARLNAITALFGGGGLEPIFDGTATAVDVYLNFAVAAAGIDADGVLTVNGTIELLVGYIGDN